MAAASAARAIGSDRSIARGYRLLAPPQKAEASQSDQRDDPGALQRPIPTQEHVYKQDRPGKDQRENGPQLPGEGVGTLRLVFHRIHLYVLLNTDTKQVSGAK